MEELKLLAQFGIGGVLAGLMFWFYRQDHKDLTELQLSTTKALAENTAAVAKLSTLLETHLADDRRGHLGAGR